MVDIPHSDCGATKACKFESYRGYIASSSFAAAVGIRKGAFVVYRAEEKPDVSIRLPSLVCLASE